jgi:hypothetical protein
MKDKRARLSRSCPLKNGTVRFPRKGMRAPDLTRLLGFNAEKHSDAVEALVYLLLGLAGEGISPQEMQSITMLRHSPSVAPPATYRATGYGFFCKGADRESRTGEGRH